MGPLVNWADFSVNALAPWSIVGVGVLAILRDKLVTRASADRDTNTAKELLSASAKLSTELLGNQIALMKERLVDKDKVIAEGSERENVQRLTITEQSSQIRVLAGLAETTNRALNALPKPTGGDQ